MASRYLWRCNDVGGGNVCFRGTGIIVSFVAERFAAGDSIDDLAKDYDLTREVVEEGIRLVVRASNGRYGVRRSTERSMEIRIPAEQHPSDKRKSGRERQVGA